MTYAGWLQLEQLRALNELVGGLAQGSMNSIVGPPEAGKTILEFQLAYESTKQLGGSAIVFDTEGSMHTYNDWHKTFNKRYGDRVLMYVQPEITKNPKTNEVKVNLKTDKFERKNQHIYILDVRSIQQVCAIHGNPINLTTSDSGKFSVRPAPGWEDDITKTAIGRFVEEHDINYLAYDSITSPLQIFGNEQLNFPARAAATNYWMLAAQLLTQTYGLMQVGVFHETVNPQDFDRPDVSGGIGAKYNMKAATYISRDKTKHTPQVLDGKDKGRDRTSRDLWILRHPSRKPFTMHKQLDLTSRGFVDIEQQKIEEVRQ